MPERNDLHMPPEHRRVYAIIQHCRGRAQAVKNADLAKAAGIGERYCRKILEELANDFNVAVGTAYGSDGGRYIIVNPQEIDETCEQKIKHGVAMLASAYRLKRACGPQIKGQVEMIFKEASHAGD